MTKSLIKFMTKEELVTMLVQIRNWKNPTTGEFTKKYKTHDEHMKSKWNLAEHRFNIKNLDFVDVLICGEGYVRYYYKNRKQVHPAVEMLKERFGFVEE